MIVPHGSWNRPYGYFYVKNHREIDLKLKIYINDYYSFLIDKTVCCRIGELKSTYSNNWGQRNIGNILAQYLFSVIHWEGIA